MIILPLPSNFDIFYFFFLSDVFVLFCFILALYMSAWSWRRWKPRNASVYRPKKPQQKPALSSQRTRKGAAQQNRKCVDGSLHSSQTSEEKLWYHPDPRLKRLRGKPWLPPSRGRNKRTPASLPASRELTFHPSLVAVRHLLLSPLGFEKRWPGGGSGLWCWQ